MDPDPCFFLSLGLVQATWETFSPQKGTSSTSTHEISKLFLFLWVILAPSWIRICISIADPDPSDQNQCESGSTALMERCGFCRWQNYIAKLQIYCNVNRPESREIAACRGTSSGGIHRQGFCGEVCLLGVLNPNILQDGTVSVWLSNSLQAYWRCRDHNLTDSYTVMYPGTAVCGEQSPDFKL